MIARQIPLNSSLPEDSFVGKVRELYKKVYFTIITSALLVILFVFIQPKNFIGLALLSLITLCGMIILGLFIKAKNLLPEKAPLVPFSIGALLIVGGALFDVINTVIQSPDLALEANIFIRFLFESNFSLMQIYWIGTLEQLLLLGIALTMWCAFLKAYPIILRSIPPSNIFLTAIRVSGGPRANILDVLIGKGDYFFSTSSLTPAIVGVFLYRWYLGLEWLDLVPISHFIAPTIIVTGSLISYFYISHRLINKPILRYT